MRKQININEPKKVGRPKGSAGRHLKRYKCDWGGVVEILNEITETVFVQFYFDGKVEIDKIRVDKLLGKLAYDSELLHNFHIFVSESKKKMTLCELTLYTINIIKFDYYHKCVELLEIEQIAEKLYNYINQLTNN